MKIEDQPTFQKIVQKLDIRLMKLDKEQFYDKRPMWDQSINTNQLSAYHFFLSYW